MGHGVCSGGCDDATYSMHYLLRRQACICKWLPALEDQGVDRLCAKGGPCPPYEMQNKVTGFLGGGVVTLPNEGLQALATALFREGDLSLSRAAKVANLVLVDFVQHVSRLGIPVVKGTVEDVAKDEEAIRT